MVVDDLIKAILEGNPLDIALQEAFKVRSPHRPQGHKSKSSKLPTQHRLGPGEKPKKRRTHPEKEALDRHGKVTFHVLTREDQKEAKK